MATYVFIPDKDHVWLSAEIISEAGEGVLQVRVTDSVVDSKSDVREVNINKLPLGLTSLPLQVG